jgi:hypothetical protein
MRAVIDRQGLVAPAEQAAQEPVPIIEADGHNGNPNNSYFSIP